MSPKRRGDWKPPRDRREVVIATLAALGVIIVTVALLWFLRPNRNSGSTSTTVTTTPAAVTTVPGSATTAPATTAPPTTTPPTTAPATTAPASTSTP